MKIEILGTGCPKCKKLKQITDEAVSELGVDAEVSKVEDINKIIEYGVMMTPALVLNGKVMVTGKVPEKSKLIELIQQKGDE